VTILLVMLAVTLGNLVLASVGYLEIVMILGLIGPVSIFYNTIRDATMPPATADEPPVADPGAEL
jgi:hypothetical protein